MVPVTPRLFLLPFLVTHWLGMCRSPQHLATATESSASSAAAAWQQYTLRRISAMVSRSAPVRPDVSQPAPKKKSPDPADRTFVVPHTDPGASPAMPGAARKKPLLQPQRILSGWWRHNRRATSGLQRLPP